MNYYKLLLLCGSTKGANMTLLLVLLKRISSFLLFNTNKTINQDFMLVLHMMLLTSYYIL